MIRFWIATVALSALLLGGCPPMTMPDDMSGGDTSVDDGNGDGGAPPVTMRPDDDNNAGGDTNPSGDGSNTGGDTGGDNGGDSNSSGDNAGGDSGNSDNAGGDSGNGDAGNNGGNTDPGDSGNPNDGGGDNGGDADQAARAGTFSGSVTWQVSQGFGGTEFPFDPQVVQLDLTFDDDGNLTEVFVPGYSTGTPDQTVSVLTPGEQTGLSTALVEYLTVNYTETTATIELKVIHNRTAGNLQEIGEGMQTITLSIAGNDLTFDSTMRYEVQLVGTGPSVDTSETYTANATLTRQ